MTVPEGASTISMAAGIWSMAACRRAWAASTACSARLRAVMSTKVMTTPSMRLSVVIGDRTPQVPCAAMRACFGLRGDQGREHQARFLGEIAVAEFGLEVIDRSPDVRPTQRDQLVHRRSEAPYLELNVQEHDPDTGAAP